MLTTPLRSAPNITKHQSNGRQIFMMGLILYVLIFHLTAFPSGKFKTTLISLKEGEYEGKAKEQK